MKGVFVLKFPGAKKRSQNKPGLRALGGSSASGDLPGDDGVPDGSFGGVVVGRNGGIGDKDKQFGLVLGNPFAQGGHWCIGTQVRPAEV